MAGKTLIGRYRDRLNEDSRRVETYIVLLNLYSGERGRQAIDEGHVVVPSHRNVAWTLDAMPPERRDRSDCETIIGTHQGSEIRPPAQQPLDALFPLFLVEARGERNQPMIA